MGVRGCSRLSVCLPQERGLQTAKYKDVCAQLHEEYFDACLAHSFVALLRVLQAQCSVVAACSILLTSCVVYF